jgi:hypothetical protein
MQHRQLRGPYAGYPQIRQARFHPQLPVHYSGSRCFCAGITDSAALQLLRLLQVPVQLAETGPRIGVQKGPPSMADHNGSGGPGLAVSVTSSIGMDLRDNLFAGRPFFLSKTVNERAGRSVAVLESPALVASLNNIAMMGQAVQQRRRHLGIVEYRRPFSEGEIGRDDD